MKLFLNAARAIALLISVVVPSLASAVPPSFDIAFTEHPLLLGTREVWVQRDSDIVLELLTQQNEYCFDPDGTDPNVSCPEQAELSFILVPVGLDVCFSTFSGACISSPSVSPGNTAYVRVRALQNAPFSDATLRVLMDVDGTSDSASASILVHITPPFFAAPAPLKLFRGESAKQINLPLIRPSSLNKPIDMFLLNAGNGISASYSPATLSTTTNATTLSVAASGSAALGTRNANIGAMVDGIFVAPTFVLTPISLTIADAITPVFESNIKVRRAIKTVVTKLVPMSATVDPDAGGSASQVSFELTGCNCTEIKAQVALQNGNTLLVQIAPSITISGLLNIGVRARLGTHTRDFIVPIQVNPSLVLPQI